MSLDPISAALDLGTALINKIFPDPAQAADAKLKLLELQQSGELATMTAQTDINKVEAANASLFVSGWRPAIGWVCALALAYQYLFKPLVSTIFPLFIAGFPQLPGLDDNLWQLMMGMLGMGGLRTFEKINGVASK
jgi:Holin of 3TMs, for gene-transfer release